MTSGKTFFIFMVFTLAMFSGLVLLAYSQAPTPSANLTYQAGSDAETILPENRAAEVENSEIKNIVPADQSGVGFSAGRS